MIDLRRGDVVFYGERGEFTGKLRPGVIVQRESTLADSPSITVCGITSFSMPTHAARVALSPSPENGLEEQSFAMIDKIASISRSRVRRVFGHLNPDEINAIDRALRSWLQL
ncbi:MAG: type II toxin-antitoxin system PemK/MazF family toxin [Sphingomonadales bacterium]|jgi:mRNA interferase MazF|nr:type II toxin-antitoxin system PemK/MazF family toxin [Sphingomonadales bacterium]